MTSIIELDIAIPSHGDLVGLALDLIGAPLDTFESSRELAAGPGRVALAVTVTGQSNATAPRRVVVKAGREVGRGHTIARAVRTSAIESDARSLKLPAPLAAATMIGVAVQEYVDGPCMATCVVDAPYRWLAEVGTALAELHRLVPAACLGRGTHIDDHLDDLFDPHPDRLAERRPAVGSRVRAVLTELRDRYRALPADRPWGAVTTHRDLHLRQMMAAEPGIWFLDWDLAACGDAALDLGNLTASLRKNVDPDIAADAVAGLYDGYSVTAPSQVLARVPLYESLTWLRFACKYDRLGGDRAATTVATMLTHAERCLS
jgi:aminoglycoside phosphotransferase (APT) family kinase protein